MPIPFTCPHCGRQTIVDDQYAGQRGPCSGCGQMVTVPISGAGPAAARPRGASSAMPVVVIVLVVVAVLLVLACGGMVLVALGLPAVQARREAARQAEADKNLKQFGQALHNYHDVQWSQCANNLKRIGLAMRNYHDVHRCFPPAYIPDDNGRPKHSWRVLILPYLEQQGTFQQYNQKEPFDGPRNRVLASTSIPQYGCPSDPATVSGSTDYVMIVGPGTISDGPQSRKIMDITDGTSNTIMVIEVSGLGINWMEPKDIALDELISKLNSEPPAAALILEKSR